MRSINSSNTSHPGKKILLIGIAALFVATGILYYTETRHITSFFIKKPTTAELTPQQKEEATKNDPTSSSSSTKSDTQPAPGVSQNQTTNQVPVSTTSTVAITTLNQSNGSVNITATITNPASSGTCTVTFTKNGAKPVTRAVNTTSNTCAATIPELEFSMIGDWQAEVRYFANNEQATATGTITIK